MTPNEHYIGLPLHEHHLLIGQILRLPFPVARPVRYSCARSGTKVHQKTSVQVTYTPNTNTRSDTFSGYTHMYFWSKMRSKTLTLSTLLGPNKHFAMWWWRNGPSSLSPSASGSGCTAMWHVIILGEPSQPDQTLMGVAMHL